MLPLPIIFNWCCSSLLSYKRISNAWERRKTRTKNILKMEPRHATPMLCIKGFDNKLQNVQHKINLQSKIDAIGPVEKVWAQLSHPRPNFHTITQIPQMPDHIRKLEWLAFCLLQSCFCRINCNGGGCEGEFPRGYWLQYICLLRNDKVTKVFSESRSWVNLSCSLDCGGAGSTPGRSGEKNGQSFDSLSARNFFWITSDNAPTWPHNGCSCQF